MKALLLIDVQRGMFGSPAGEPHDGEGVVRRLDDLLGRARASSMPVFFVQHDGGRGSPLAMDSPGFAWREELAPRGDESVTVKRQCSAFWDTGLLSSLQAAGVDHLVIGGMQSEFCVDSAVRGAFERGLRVTLLQDGHTTFDTPALAAEQIIAHHNHTLSSGNFATLCSAAGVEEMAVKSKETGSELYMGAGGRERD